MSEYIDPIVMREHAQRFRAEGERARVGAAAINALLWFQEHAVTPGAHQEPQPDTIKGGPRLVASATAHADAAQAYIDRATDQVRGEIIARAIAIAQTDMRRAKKAEAAA